MLGDRKKRLELGASQRESSSVGMRCQTVASNLVDHHAWEPRELMTVMSRTTP